MTATNTTKITSDEWADLRENLILLHKRSGECMDDINNFVDACGVANLVAKLNAVVDHERIDLLERLFWAHLDQLWYNSNIK